MDWVLAAIAAFILYRFGQAVDAIKRIEAAVQDIANKIDPDDDDER